MEAASSSAFVRDEIAPTLRPPRGQVGLVGWLRANLFSSVGNSITSILIILFLAWVLPPFFAWAFIHPAWQGTSREACLAHPDGACWAFVNAKFGQFIYGRYPDAERWRANLTFLLLLLGAVPTAIPKAPFKRATITFLITVVPIAALVLLTGGHFSISARLIGALIVAGPLLAALIGGLALRTRRTAPGLIALGAGVLGLLLLLASFALPAPPTAIAGLPTNAYWVAIILCALVGASAAVVGSRATPGRPMWRLLAILFFGLGAAALVLMLLGADFGLSDVDTSLWGGLLVTLVVALVGIAASLPIGILLALGRRSDMPMIRLFSIIFIEFWRGVPLITVLFMSSVMLPVFLPPGVNFDKLLRALIGVALFSAAYMAEVVRGGLQAIPKGQYEGAMALGLGYWPMMRLIVLPQALTLVIPGIVNSFISLFKDTSLVLIIGIFDLLGIIQLNFADANWASPETPVTGYVFAALVFWLFCFSMSRYSIYTERRLNTGHRR